MTLKTLLIFAHYGEAQAFIDSPIPGTDVLICGEGLSHALYKTSESLIHEGEKYASVVNLGIAGSFSPQHKVGDIFSIKTVYAENEFKSFKLDDENAKVDLISAQKRIKRNEDQKSLSHYANLVDRELWAIAFACSKKKYKLYSYKLVSDRADETVVCENIAENAKTYSKQLYDYFLMNFPQMEKIERSLAKGLPQEWENHFHFSHTQRKKLESLTERLSLLGMTDLYSDELLESCKLSSPLPKDRTNFLLKKLAHLLNPSMAKVEAKLDELVSPLVDIGAKVHFSPEFEEEYFTISMKIETEKNLEKLKKSLDEINYRDIVDVLQGNHHV
jgi:hypothetical protein